MKYIGQRKIGQQEPYFGSGKILKQAIKKYGIENFTKEILCECETKEELNQKEIEYIAKVDAANSPEYYNISIGGPAPTAGRPLSDDHKKKISEARMGHEVLEDTRKKISESMSGENHPNFGKPRSENTRKKISENHADISGENHPKFGKKDSNLTIKKKSESHKNYWKQKRNSQINLQT